MSTSGFVESTADFPGGFIETMTAFPGGFIESTTMFPGGFIELSTMPPWDFIHAVTEAQMDIPDYPTTVFPSDSIMPSALPLWNFGHATRKTQMDIPGDSTEPPMMLPGGFTFDMAEPDDSLQTPNLLHPTVLHPPSQNYIQLSRLTETTRGAEGIQDNRIPFDPSFFPDLKTLVIVGDDTPYALCALSRLLSSPESSPSLKTLVLSRCDLSEELMTKLTLFVSERKYTQRELDRVTIVRGAQQRSPSDSSIRALEEYVSVSDVLIYEPDAGRRH